MTMVKHIEHMEIYMQECFSEPSEQKQRQRDINN